MNVQQGSIEQNVANSLTNQALAQRLDLVRTHLQAGRASSIHRGSGQAAALARRLRQAQGDSMNNPGPVNAIIDTDNDTFTVAFTFRWKRPWALDKCEVGSVLGGLRRAVEAELTANASEQVAGFSYTCFDPAEETDLGYIADYVNPVCAGCGAPVRYRDPKAWHYEWEHVDIIPLGDDGLPVCHHLAHQSDTEARISACDRPHLDIPNVVNFPNLLDVTIKETA